MADKTETFAPSAADMETLARAALARIPEPFAAYLADVVLVIEDFADEQTLRDMGMEDPFELTGLYSGRPVGEKDGFMGELPQPDTIHLYRRPLLDEWVETGVSLEALVTHVVVHEVGHHFGLSDDDMHALEDSVG
ncbi:neutral zinc metallopeptidase [Sphingomonas koreensis]|jgi:predicted Zn-dependent protease with MMP-like domain|uniref:Neutral zinc metallopeptidase n=1 Tax=Sphingomonas koreensis TaxID=93064 RepID=A0A1L6J7I3_9SPHN|nr:metallopeptidase family protein [Sphingomonas koreensis]APR51490.1 neutral zinc metallopeptidase [Sphingomonas koreensis]MDC7812880.1 metallopeptidase family protein [Sphingomonas koreensis]RSU22621.1 neutral zinc metallopeptidase [Sphingomonas koreensis]RSU27650.1 neutral zinc metallopeptidase [Sphingomonas koreensis]RSU29159.1 neutral zinc metallopeptidase [Sphingomonas koreensis]